MDMINLLKGVEIFDGLSDDELSRVARICRPANFRKGDLITVQGEEGDEMFIVQEGMVEVTVGEAEGLPQRSLVNLGMGQVAGEMALVDRGPRSATVRCVSDVTVNVIKREAFERLCQEDTRIGMLVYRNLAADLSFKLRHRLLTRR